MKILKIDIEEFSKSSFFQNIITEKDKNLLKYILECTNIYLENEQKQSDVQKMREKHVANLAASKLHTTEKLIAEYARRADLFSEGVNKYKIANIAMHINRTDKTVRNVLTSYANLCGIDIADKLQDYVFELCTLLMKKYNN